MTSSATWVTLAAMNWFRFLRQDRNFLSHMCHGPAGASSPFWTDIAAR